MNQPENEHNLTLTNQGTFNIFQYLAHATLILATRGSPAEIPIPASIQRHANPKRKQPRTTTIKKED
jgi:hypothetical protein